MPERYVCIHGHFYQPPRENPWLGAVEPQESAYPYHDWNERVTAECYGPNGAAHILDEDGRVARIVNNYARISYNVGPTLLAWMEGAAPQAYAAIVAADRESARRFGGHGSAMAQVYNHAIMPLADTRDKLTQIRWGIADFRHRFGREPEGMWLAETAVDLETLDLLAGEGIAFTVLSPHQASRVLLPDRAASESGAASSQQPAASGSRNAAPPPRPSPQWRDVTGGRIDPTRAYVQRLPSGRSIALFFYDGAASQAVAFAGLLSDGGQFAERLLGILSDERDAHGEAQLAHIATDGESYGHHHPHGEMALAYALHTIEQSGRARLTNYGEFLALHPPTAEVEIIENTAWSSSDGVERWRSDSGGNTGANPEWNQAWREPLRRALDGLRDAVAPRYERAMRSLVRDPWAARDAYIRVVLDRSGGSIAAFLDAHAARDLTAAERVVLLQSLEMQRHALLMYTSCGWFFDDISRIETLQILRHAARVMQLAGQLFGESFEGPFLAVLDGARSNEPEYGTGRDLYERLVRPAILDLPDVAAQYVLGRLFESHAATERIHCYRVAVGEYAPYAAGGARLILGHGRFTSEITGESEELTFGVFNDRDDGDATITGGVRPFTDAAGYAALVRPVMEAFARGDYAGTHGLLGVAFAGSTALFASEVALEEMRVAASLVAITQEALASGRVPRATYRFQFNRTFTLANARALVPYLAELGISDVYASPLLRATPGSMHGYDTIDHGRVNPEIGDEADLDALAAALRARGMGLLLDIVPNHMGIGHPDNGWWQDVLENGPSSIHARAFDINWYPIQRELENKVLIPILGGPYGQVLEGGDLTLRYAGGAFAIGYYDNLLPVAPQTYGQILDSEPLVRLREELGDDDEGIIELLSIGTALANLPAPTDSTAAGQAVRNREKEVVKRRLAALCEGAPAVEAAIAEAVARFNAHTEEGRDLMDALLAAQSYRPAFWRVATEEINYRRFFDINTLAAIRVEVPEVFDATHALALRWLAAGIVTGLRIDHPDGLRDPTNYFHQLQEQYVLARVRAALPPDAHPDDLEARVRERFAREWDGADATRRHRGPLYVVAEKILSEGEALPEAWKVSGTTGYDWLNAASGLFVAENNAAAFDALYTRLTGVVPDFAGLVNGTKKVIMLVSLASEINYLAYLLERIAERNRMYRDFTLNSLTFALREVIAALPVYRTYTTDESRESRAQDAGYVDAAVAEAKTRNPRTAAALFDFLRDTVLLRNLGEFPADDQPEVREFVLKWQQVTGPVMAKGVEDTAFYIYNRLVSLNEVGGHPAHFGVSPAAFHAANAHAAAAWPHTLLATATHDTKRGEDTRARIHVLGEMPEAWEAAARRWAEINAAKRPRPNAPDRKDEYLLYQTLLGTWPTGAMDAEATAAYRERIEAYMLKAIKEAKQHTSWVNPNEGYDAAVRSFARALIAGDPADEFRAAFAPLARTVAYFGVFNSLAQQLLKLTSPGVPDVYQGTELWDFSLVDPDNRRPVDYAARHATLRDLQSRMAGDRAELARELLDAADDGRVKLFLTHAALAYRRDHEELFRDGGYTPLDATGAHAAHVVAFARAAPDGGEILTVVPRLVATLLRGAARPPLGADVWGDTALPLPGAAAGTRYRNTLMGEEVTVTTRGGIVALPVGAIFAHFPVALLERI